MGRSRRKARGAGWFDGPPTPAGPRRPDGPTREPPRTRSTGGRTGVVGRLRRRSPPSRARAGCTGKGPCRRRGRSARGGTHAPAPARAAAASGTAPDHLQHLRGLGPGDVSRSRRARTPTARRGQSRHCSMARLRLPRRGHRRVTRRRRLQSSSAPHRRRPHRTPGAQGPGVDAALWSLVLRRWGGVRAFVD